MISKKNRADVRTKKHSRIRNRISGTAEKPRLAVFRSNNHMYAQIIDDTVGNTLVSASTVQKDVKAELEKIYPPIPKNVRNEFKMNPKEIFKTALDVHEGEPVLISGEREHLPYIVEMVDYLYSKNKTKLVDVTFTDD